MKNSSLIKWGVLASLCVFSSSLECASVTPESVLPAGVDSTISVNPYTGDSGEARKGTIAATINNIARLNQLLSREETEQSLQEIQELSSIIDQLIPSLQVIGVFDWFEPIYWIGDGKQPGRVLTLALYFKRYPEKCTPVLRKELSKVKDQTSSVYLRQQLEALDKTLS